MTFLLFGLESKFKNLHDEQYLWSFVV